MDNNINLLNNIDLSNLQIDYSQMQLSFLNDILNSDFLGFNNLDFGLRLFLLLVIIFLSVYFIIKTIQTFKHLILKTFRFINNKYEMFSEKKFNTLSARQLDNKLKHLSNFILVCDFDFKNKSFHPDIISEFSRAFLINHSAKVKHEKTSITFVFDGFYKIINGVITQLYLTKTLFEQNHPELKIYLSGTIVEKDENYEIQSDLVKGLVKLKVNQKYLTCDTIFKLYYGMIEPQLYELQSNGEYLIQNKTVEIYTITPPVDRTL